MSRALKAALLSGLVFPGTGHLLLKRYARGWILIAVCAVATYVLLNQVMQQANAVLQNLETGGGVVSMESISSLVQDSAAKTDAGRVTLATWVLILGWLFAIIDSYRLGKKAPDAH